MSHAHRNRTAEHLPDGDQEPDEDHGTIRQMKHRISELHAQVEFKESIISELRIEVLRLQQTNDHLRSQRDEACG